MITVSWQTIITAAAVLAAVGAILKTYNKGYDLVKHQKEQDKDIQDIKTELAIATEGILACLQGLKEQGCDGPVTEAINKINTHLNQKAHGM